jgi:undecaprenyl diphosphate synthase
MSEVLQVMPAQNVDDADTLRAQLQLDSIPRHVAVIMDGNGRWGLLHGLTRCDGHRKATDAMWRTVDTADKLGIGYLSLYAFSTENVSRPPAEVEALFTLFSDVLDEETPELHRRNIKVIVTGELDDLPPPLPAKFRETTDLTANNTGLVLNLCIMYSGRTELLRAARLAAQAAADGGIDPAELTERQLRGFFYHPGVPDVDLTIRTSGEQRISNFLLWQMAYSELVFSEVLWPDYTVADFLAALLQYQMRNRRFGKL